MKISLSLILISLCSLLAVSETKPEPANKVSPPASPCHQVFSKKDELRKLSQSDMEKLKAGQLENADNVDFSGMNLEGVNFDRRGFYRGEFDRGEVDRGEVNSGGFDRGEF